MEWRSILDFDCIAFYLELEKNKSYFNDDFPFCQAFINSKSICILANKQFLVIFIICKQEPQNSAYNGISIKTPTEFYDSHFFFPIVNAIRNT